MNYQVVVNFDDGTNSYDFPLVANVSDPIPGSKATVIEGVRGDGSIVIPAGKKSQEIIVRGVFIEDGDGYKDLVTAINEMRTKVTKDIATLTLKHYDGGWINDWQVTVRRIAPIVFTPSLRTNTQKYIATFFVIGY